MINIKDIAFTIYAVTDMKTSRAFYEGILGLKTGTEFDGSGNANWVEYIVNGNAFAIGCSPDWKPSEDGATTGFEVDDFDATIKELKAKNVPFKLEPQDFPTCRMAVIKDPDNNNIVIHRKK